jgi:hypothetical protein
MDDRTINMQPALEYVQYAINTTGSGADWKLQ